MNIKASYSVIHNAMNLMIVVAVCDTLEGMKAWK